MVCNTSIDIEYSKWGRGYQRPGKPKPFSDDHEVVIVPLFLKNKKLLAETSAALPTTEGKMLSETQKPENTGQSAIAKAAAKAELLKTQAPAFRDFRLTQTSGSNAQAQQSATCSSPPRKTYDPRFWGPEPTTSCSSSTANSTQLPMKVVCSSAERPAMVCTITTETQGTMGSAESPDEAGFISSVEQHPVPIATSNAPCSAPEGMQRAVEAEMDSAVLDQVPLIETMPKKKVTFGDVNVDTDIDQAPSFMLPSVDTPLYRRLLKKLSQSEDPGALEAMAELCIYDKLKSIKQGDCAETMEDAVGEPYRLGLRMENLLKVTDEQRRKHIAKLQMRGDARANNPETLVFEANDMKEIMTSWEANYRSWSNRADSLDQMGDTKRKQQIHAKFPTYLFQLFGNKHLVETFIRYPICSAEQPLETLTTFIQGWKKWRNSEQADAIRRCSEKKPEGHIRLSQQIRALKLDMTRAARINKSLWQCRSTWWTLSEEDRMIWHQWSSGELVQRISALEQQQTSKFQGAAEWIHSQR